MNYFARRRFRKNDNYIVKLAVKHFDRPTDLKNALMKINKEHLELIEDIKIAIPEFSNYPPVQDDLRLALLRTVCSDSPHLYSLILDHFPVIEHDFRAIQSLDFYKNKSLNFFLGIDNEEEHEFQGEATEVIESEMIDVEIFDETLFAHLEYELGNDFGLIDIAKSTKRTLNNLRDSINQVTAKMETDSSIQLLQSILVHIVSTNSGARAIRDFFVASLRSLGEKDSLAAAEFGELFVSSIPDHRAMRSMVIFMKRVDKVDEAIRLMYHPNFKHDHMTRKWQKQLNIRRKELILDDKLKPKFEEFGNNFQALTEFMDDLYHKMNEDIDIARYMYRYCIEVHKNVQHKPLANEVIRWGEAVIKIESETPEPTLAIESKITQKGESDNKKSIERYEREIRRIQNSASMRIGLYLTNSFRNPVKIILLPILLPVYCLILGLEKLGYKKKEVVITQSTNIKQIKDCVVLFPTNGVGFGHFTRMYAVARSIRKQSPDTDIVFFTPMPTLHILYADNFPTYHLAGRYKHADMNARQWNGIVEEMLTIVFETHKPRAFIFDGAYPYRGMLNAINAQTEMSKWWMRRGTFKKNKSIPNGSIDSFDYTISPQDIDEVVTSKYQDSQKTHNVPPVTLIENDEMLDRISARNTLSVPQNAKVVYVQLGAGRINEIDSTIRIVLDCLLQNENLYVVLGESLLGQRTMISMERVRIIRDYPNALFFKAFDASVQAGGYNSFHEMRRLHLPTVFIPNTNTGMDDQLRRVKKSEEEGWGIVCKENKKSIHNAIGMLLELEPPNPPVYPNGASVTAELLLAEMNSF